MFLRAYLLIEAAHLVSPTLQLTVEAIRATRKKMFMGMTEREASTKIAALLASAGLQNGGCLTLFGGTSIFP